MQAASRPSAGSPDTKPRRRGVVRYATGLRALSISTVVAVAVTLGLVFFYAPLEAEQGFLQKIFYVHVPLAIVALCGFVLGAVFAVLHLRTRDPRWDMRSYVAIHMSLIFAVGVLDHGLDLGEGLVGALVGVERADARVVPDHVSAVRDLPAAALRDRGSRAPGALRLGVRDHGRGVRADELHRGAPLDRLSASAGAGQHLESAGAAWHSPSWSRCWPSRSSTRRSSSSSSRPSTPARSCARCAVAPSASRPSTGGPTGPSTAQRSARAVARPDHGARERKVGAMMPAPLFGELPALPLHTAGKYVAGAYVVIFALVLDICGDHGHPRDPRSSAGWKSCWSEQTALSRPRSSTLPARSRRWYERATGARHLPQDGPGRPARAPGVHRGRGAASSCRRPRRATACARRS